jgi:hypothetical protein
MATDIQAQPEHQPTVEQEPPHLAELFTEAPEMGGKAFESVLKELDALASQEPPPPVVRAEFLDNVGDQAWR